MAPRCLLMLALPIGALRPASTRRKPTTRRNTATLDAVGEFRKAAGFARPRDVYWNNLELVDALSTIVGRVNVNMQCARGPDVFPFSGRRSSAMGTMSTTESLRAFSVETLVAVRDDAAGRAFGDALSTRAKFLLPTA